MRDKATKRPKCRIKINGLCRDLDRDGDARILPFAGFGNWSSFWVTSAYIEKHNPQSGGFYVVDENGHESYEPPEPEKPDSESHS